MDTKDEATQKMLAAMNKVVNKMLGYSGRSKGTRTYYYAGRVGNKSFCFTKNKTTYNGRWGFWSWIQTEYKKSIKRTKFAKSGSRVKARARANKLYEKYKEKTKSKEEKNG